MLRYSDMKPYSKKAWKEGYTPESWSEHQSFVFWAKVIVIVLLGLFILPFVTHADTRHRLYSIHLTPTTTPVLAAPVKAGGGSPTVGVASGFCTNALHDNPTTPSAIMAEIQ